MTSVMRLVLRYRGHRCRSDGAVQPRYFAGSLTLREGDEFVVGQDGLVLGRGRSADVRVASNGVARHHVRVSIAQAGWLRAEDLGSTNGTQKNGQPGIVHELAPGDVLTLADCFDFEVVEA